MGKNQNLSSLTSAEGKAAGNLRTSLLHKAIMTNTSEHQQAPTNAQNFYNNIDNSYT